MICNNIKWSKFKKGEDDGTYDWCGKLYGKNVDIMSSYLGTWSVDFCNKRLKDDFKTREEAIHWAETEDLIIKLAQETWD